ncbi:MAG: hypothetical protein QOK05_709 [Chloroflexota bacterium]|nr:hypothetical protein [Chloroflexota bacterium]
MVAPGHEGIPPGSRFGDAAVISVTETGEMLGIIGNIEIAEYPGVAGLVIYVDEKRARAGYAMIAWFRYVDRMFQLGAVKIQMEVLSFNTPVHRIMRRIGARPEALLREHFYIAGRHWDATLYGFDRQAWQAVDKRYREVVRHPSAVASSRQGSQVLQLKRTPANTETAPTDESPMEAIDMKVDYLVLADAAIATEGKHYLHGAGWDSLVAVSLPVFHRHMAAALRLRLPGGGATRRLGVDVVNPEGASILAAPIYNDLVPASADQGLDEQAMALVFNFDSLHFTQAGRYSVVVSVDGVELHRTPFTVRTA